MKGRWSGTTRFAKQDHGDEVGKELAVVVVVSFAVLLRIPIDANLAEIELVTALRGFDIIDHEACPAAPEKAVGLPPCR